MLTRPTVNPGLVIWMKVRDDCRDRCWIRERNEI
jgi:hypothetical protein